MRDFPGIMQPPFGGGEEQNTGIGALDWGEQEWGTHRFHVRSLVQESIQLLAKPEKVVVLGAGNHGDVDLPGLAVHFQQVTVLDTEDNMLEEWLNETGGLAQSRLKSLTRVDYTCLDHISFYETFEEMLMNGVSGAEVAGYLRDCVFEARRNEALPHLNKSFSLVVSSGVHTQLFYIDALTQFYSHIERYGDQDIRLIMEALAYLRNNLMTDYNGLLLSLVKPEGRVTVWTDMILLDEDKKWIAEELSQPREDRERARFLFEAFGKYGMEAAVVGLKDLHDRLRPEKLLFRSWVWHTESGKTYIVAGLSGHPRS
ncbi:MULTISPECIES: hypothetical protein [unclassified Paenibacillus]|uniref:hypothetical protein n=1 Tax=unclassified Paenibacillus TaxID=185978 RepID=UPI001B79AA60|nr:MULTISPECIES: hypothetical protein [unclassified Paenibacillus]MBP1156180.1 hypothetical protein [Paenibacillus sp. PvP091]MBP1168434.1 hypothetical protein [Paenibacillus sp. PvR098]MBP2439462.1 hypothetical protein [Paenibacillus sp. PvP052]